ncbi:uncharacterized protein LOC128249505 [Octopus bimaculoides]|uniref:uncharacterized protein LOC128249505 n=1 Tax=Octopus bimaculoides TaxID=37653 RepID=UPI0022DF12B4|nr:uncharacterized protein LOC128249505 [Octopus bimaculoides]
MCFYNYKATGRCIERDNSRYSSYFEQFVGISLHFKTEALAVKHTVVPCRNEKCAPPIVFGKENACNAGDILQCKLFTTIELRNTSETAVVNLIPIASTWYRVQFHDAAPWTSVFLL